MGSTELGLWWNEVSTPIPHQSSLICFCPSGIHIREVFSTHYCSSTQWRCICKTLETPEVAPLIRTLIACFMYYYQSPIICACMCVYVVRVQWSEWGETEIVSDLLYHLSWETSQWRAHRETLTVWQENSIHIPLTMFHTHMHTCTHAHKTQDILEQRHPYQMNVFSL